MRLCDTENRGFSVDTDIWDWKKIYIAGIKSPRLLFAGINKSNILKLYRVQNSLATAITKTVKYVSRKGYVLNWGS